MKKRRITTTNRLRNHKYIFYFPICDSYAEAHRKYFNVKPANIVGVIIILFSVISWLNPFTSFPKALFYLGGVLWLTIVIGYLVWMNKKVRRENNPEVIKRNSLLKNAVRFEKVNTPGKNKAGEARIIFSNSKFAQAFTYINIKKEV